MQAADIQTQPNVCFLIPMETCKADILDVATVLMKFFFFLLVYQQRGHEVSLSQEC